MLTLFIKKGGFTSDGGITFWSRPGGKKEPSGGHFNYSKDINPQATDHWGQGAAEQAGQKGIAYRSSKFIFT